MVPLLARRSHQFFAVYVIVLRVSMFEIVILTKDRGAFSNNRQTSPRLPKVSPVRG